MLVGVGIGNRIFTPGDVGACVGLSLIFLGGGTAPPSFPPPSRGRIVPEDDLKSTGDSGSSSVRQSTALCLNRIVAEPISLKNAGLSLPFPFDILLTRLGESGDASPSCRLDLSRVFVGVDTFRGEFELEDCRDVVVPVAVTVPVPGPVLGPGTELAPRPKTDAAVWGKEAAPGCFERSTSPYSAVDLREGDANGATYVNGLVGDACGREDGCREGIGGGKSNLCCCSNEDDCRGGEELCMGVQGTAMMVSIARTTATTRDRVVERA